MRANTCHIGIYDRSHYDTRKLSTYSTDYISTTISDIDEWHKKSDLLMLRVMCISDVFEFVKYSSFEDVNHWICKSIQKGIDEPLGISKYAKRK